MCVFCVKRVKDMLDIVYPDWNKILMFIFYFFAFFYNKDLLVFHAKKKALLSLGELFEVSGVLSKG